MRIHDLFMHALKYPYIRFILFAFVGGFYCILVRMCDQQSLLHSQFLSSVFQKHCLRFNDIFSWLGILFTLISSLPGFKILPNFFKWGIYFFFYTHFKHNFSAMLEYWISGRVILAFRTGFLLSSPLPVCGVEGGFIFPLGRVCSLWDPTAGLWNLSPELWTSFPPRT